MKASRLTHAALGALLALALGAAPANAGPSARAAATCSDYDNQADAQRNADTRDADGDGIYCETCRARARAAAADQADPMATKPLNDAGRRSAAPPHDAGPPLVAGRPRVVALRAAELPSVVKKRVVARSRTARGSSMTSSTATP